MESGASSSRALWPEHLQYFSAGTPSGYLEFMEDFPVSRFRPHTWQVNTYCTRPSSVRSDPLSLALFAITTLGQFRYLEFVVEPIHYELGSGNEQQRTSCLRTQHVRPVRISTAGHSSKHWATRHVRDGRLALICSAKCDGPCISRG